MPIADPQSFFVDGYAYSWRSTLHTIDGIPRRGFRAVDWEESLEREKAHQAIRSGKPLLITFGEYDVKSLTLTMLPQEKQWLKAYVRDKGSGGASSSVARASFTYQLQLSENGYVITMTYKGCRFKSLKGSLKIGPETAESPTEFDCMSITERDINGVTTLYDDLRDQGDFGPGF